jgi:hypothetical protein
MALLPSLTHLSLTGMDAGEWRKRKGSEERKSDVKKAMKAEVKSSDEWKDFEATFKKDVKDMVTRHTKVGLRLDPDPIGYFNAQLDLFRRMVRWFVADERRDFVLGNKPDQLQGNPDLIKKFRTIVSPFEDLCDKTGYQYDETRKMVHTHLMIGILQVPSGRGGLHHEKVARSLKELRTMIILADKEAGNQSAAPAAAPAEPSYPGQEQDELIDQVVRAANNQADAWAEEAERGAAQSSGAGPSSSSAPLPPSGVTPEFQRKLDAFEDRLEQIDAETARIRSLSDDPELPALKENLLFREMVEKEMELLKAQQVHANAKQALADARSAGTMTLQMITDEQKADGAVIDLEVEISDLRTKIERIQGF